MSMYLTCAATFPCNLKCFKLPKGCTKITRSTKAEVSHSTHWGPKPRCLFCNARWKEGKQKWHTESQTSTHITADSQSLFLPQHTKFFIVDEPSTPSQAGELRKAMGTQKHRSFSLVFRIRLEVAISGIESMRLFVHKHSLYILHIV